LIYLRNFAKVNCKHWKERGKRDSLQLKKMRDIDISERVGGVIAVGDGPDPHVGNK
jgi:hypothetical protein